MTTKALSLAVFFVAAGFVRGESNQLVSARQSPYFVRFKLSNELVKALVGKTKTVIVRKIGSPRSVTQCRGGKEYWEYHNGMYIVFEKGLATEIDIERQTGVIDEIEELP